MKKMGEIKKKEYIEKNAWGLLTSIDLFNCDSQIIRDENKIKEYVVKLCSLIDMKTFGEPVVVNFGEDERVAGFSMFQLIETSCVSGHFANQSNSVYIDIFSCKWYEQKKAVEFTKDFFKEERVKVRRIIRGENIIKN
jgi:S-adenosylmethionine/arginine decarboxylase-like enzyme